MSTSISVRGTFRLVGPSSSVSLLEIAPELAGVLSEEQRAEAQRLLLPVAKVDQGGDVTGLLEESGAFSAIVLDGMLVQALQIGENPTLRLIGPGSPAPATCPRSMPVLGARLFVPVTTRLVLLDEHMLVAARRWPWIMPILHARMLEQSDQLATQLAICQLPRVEDRVMAMMWLLADSWGRVTPAGIRLPVPLSHEVLGGLVGARRPTVTLALSKLAERGALIKQQDEWLILEPPVASVSTEPKAPELLLTPHVSSDWPADPIESHPKELGDLILHVAQARERVAQDRRHSRELAEQARFLLERTRRLMSEIERES